MKLTRRAFAILTILVLPLLVVALPAAIPNSTSGAYFAYVGTYTAKTKSKGIYAHTFEPEAGKLTENRVAAETPDPSFLVVHPNGQYLYAVNEGPVTDDGSHGAVTSFSLDKQTGKLTQLNQVSSLGTDPCFISIDKTGKFLLVANYTSGNVAVFPILQDGKIGEATANIQHRGATGPNKDRQEAPHAHWIHTTADNRFAVAVDLGLDEVLVYKFDAKKGTLTPNEPPFVRIRAGSGPRHLVFSANEKYAYVASELASTVTALKFDAKKGTFKEFQTLSTLPPGFSGRNDVAEIALHPNGRFLYVSNRGNDSIAIYDVAPNGTLAATGGTSTGGKEPRHFTFDPSGKFLFVENQLSDEIDIFRVDPTTGALSSEAQTIKVPSPVCVVFAQAN
jgi:6-phosphogluconolactonase